MPDHKRQHRGGGVGKPDTLPLHRIFGNKSKFKGKISKIVTPKMTINLLLKYSAE
jgi:hypothetical protein